MLGYRRSAPVSDNVGEVLPWRERHSELLPTAREELHALIGQPSLRGIPLLVLGNKSDLPNRLTVDELISELRLGEVSHREVCCYGISAKEETNLEAVIECLMRWAK
jgi:ADP-ribosylation factor-like protein 8